MFFIASFIATMAHQGNVDAAILKLLASLPKEFSGFWYTINELTDHIHDGGIGIVPRSAVAKAVHADKVVFKRNRWKGTMYFMKGDPKEKGLSPKKQKQHDTEVLGYLPHMPRGYFMDKDELKALASIVTSRFRPKPNVMTRAASARSADSRATSETESNLFCQTTNNESPEGLTKLRVGSVLQDIDLDIEWTNRVVEHVKKCAKAKLEVVQNTHHGAELVTTYKCRFCKEELVKRRSVDEGRIHPGAKASVINRNLAHAIFCSGTNVQKALELFAEAGIQCPSASVMQELLDKVEDSVSDLSEETLERNRKEHMGGDSAFCCRATE